MELHVIVSANVYNNVFVSMLIVLEAAQYSPCKSTDFIVCFMTYMLNI